MIRSGRVLHVTNTPRSSLSWWPPAGAPASAAARSAAWPMMRQVRSTADRVLVNAFHVADHFRARLAQSRRQHGGDLQQELGGQVRLLADDLRQIVAREH